LGSSRVHSTVRVPGSWPKAIEKYLDDNRWQVEAIEEGVRDADAGLIVPHGDVEKWVKSWSKKKPLRKPR
jgi:predicted transcriptional regulator